MKISYAIPVCDEVTEIAILLQKVVEWKRPEDEICVLLDKPKAPPVLIDILYEFSSKDQIKLRESAFDGNFSNWKNELTRMCSGDYIFQIDADELPLQDFIDILPQILQQDPDVILVPRVNIVDGLTPEHIQRWGWRVDEKQRVNWPDYQWRIYKNVSYIKWINKVHERLEGFKSYAALPAEEEYALVHVKNIGRQEKQNNYYETL